MNSKIRWVTPFSFLIVILLALLASSCFAISKKAFQVEYKVFASSEQIRALALADIPEMQKQGDWLVGRFEQSGSFVENIDIIAVPEKQLFILRGWSFEDRTEKFRRAESWIEGIFNVNHVKYLKTETKHLIDPFQ